MHSPGAALANKSCTSLEQMYAQFLRCICAVKLNTPGAMMLTEFGLSPLKAYQRKHTLEFVNKLATSLLGLFSTLSCLTISEMHFREA